MTDYEKLEERRQMARSNYYAQMAMMGYDSSGNALDLVKVVRCKDCKHSIENAKHIDVACEMSYDPDFYCAAGERMDENETG